MDKCPDFSRDAIISVYEKCPYCGHAKTLHNPDGTDCDMCSLEENLRDLIGQLRDEAVFK